METPPFSKEVFLKHYPNKRGVSNPEKITNPVWEFIVRHSPELATGGALLRHFGIDPTYEKPEWEFFRTWGSRVFTAERQIAFIGGTHEMAAYPDFINFNDVVVITSDSDYPLANESSQIDFYIYPESIFPHLNAATSVKVDDAIYIIGGDMWGDAKSLVYKLNLSSWSIASVKTKGAAPKNIFEHHASYDPAANSIRVRRGKINSRSGESRDNYAVYELNLDSMRWRVVGEDPPDRHFKVEYDDTHNGDWHVGYHYKAFMPKSLKQHWMPPEFTCDGDLEYYFLNVDHCRIIISESVSPVEAVVQGDISDERAMEILSHIGKARN